MLLAIAQFQPVKGDYQANLSRLREVFAHVDEMEPRPRILVLPETALSGYFLEGGVRDLAMAAGALVRDLDDVYRESVRSPRSLDEGYPASRRLVRLAAISPSMIAS